MIHVEIIDLSARGVTLPSDRVGMVIAQPYISLTSTEPYRWTAQAKEQQLAVLHDTMTVALAVRHTAAKTHFTIFPEYSIPGPDGIALVDAAIHHADWPAGTIVIGGTDALSKEDFTVLVGSPDTYLDETHNALDRIAPTQWINCAITWVKGADGTVERWLQPKLSPAWPERDIQFQYMFAGGSVFLFQGPSENGTQYRFSSLVCFDWVSTVHSKKAWRWVLEALEYKAAQVQAELSLSWLFVIQCNEKPSHDSFLSEVIGFFDRTILPTVHRESTCLVFANSAGKVVPGKADFFGNTSLVFSRATLFAIPKCYPTFSHNSERFRLSTLLTTYRDVLFRERGACIHSFTQVNPNSLNAGAAERAIALEDVFVFPLNGVTDPRTPAAPVPACIKWLNDELDDLPKLSDIYLAVPLTELVNTAHREAVAALRLISPQAATRTVKLAAQESIADHADDWGTTEAEALVHLVHTLSIIGIGFTATTIGSDSAHATVTMNDQIVDFLAIRGTTHELCIEHSKKHYQRLPRRQILLISRDHDNTAWRQRFGSFLQANSPQFGGDRNITDPDSGALHLGYQKLLDIFRQSATATAVRGAIYAELTI